jgi:nitrate reductase cytochrome c-type subunit
MQAIESMDLKLTIVPKKKGKKTPVASLKQSLMISHLINKYQLEDCKCFSCHPEKRRQIEETPVSKISQGVFDCIAKTSHGKKDSSTLSLQKNQLRKQSKENCHILQSTMLMEA